MGEGNKDAFSLETLALTQFAMNVICSLVLIHVRDSMIKE